MAQSLYRNKDGSQAAVETESSRFIQLIGNASLGELTRISQETKDPIQLELLSMVPSASVRSNAVMNESISRDVLKKRIEFGDISVSFSGLKNPIIFKSENIEFFQSTLDLILSSKDTLLLQALLKNPAITPKWIERIFDEEIGIYEMGRKDTDVIKRLLEHTNTPALIKIKYASSEGTNFNEEMLRNAAKESLRKSSS